MARGVVEDGDMDAVKTGAKWVGKMYLWFILLVVAVAFVGGVLSDPFGSATGGNAPISERCAEWGDC